MEQHYQQELQHLATLVNSRAFPAHAEMKGVAAAYQRCVPTDGPCFLVLDKPCCPHCKGALRAVWRSGVLDVQVYVDCVALQPLEAAVNAQRAWAREEGGATRQKRAVKSRLWSLNEEALLTNRRSPQRKASRQNRSVDHGRNSHSASQQGSTQCGFQRLLLLFASYTQRPNRPQSQLLSQDLHFRGTASCVPRLNATSPPSAKEGEETEPSSFGLLMKGATTGPRVWCAPNTIPRSGE
jgi:hypothetical protein